MYVCMYVCMYVSTLCSVALIIIVQNVTSKARVQWSESMCVRNEVICPTVCMWWQEKCLPYPFNMAPRNSLWLSLMPRLR